MAYTEGQAGHLQKHADIDLLTANHTTQIAAGDVTNPASAAALSLPATIASVDANAASTFRVQSDARLAAKAASWRAARPGNRVSVLSDSIGRGVYSGDSEPGIGGAGAFYGGASWLTFAVAVSGGRIVRAVNASVIGNTSTQMLARITTDVINHASKPTTCIVCAGYNDAEQGIGASLTSAQILATYVSNITAIVGNLRAGGITPVLATPLPTVNSAPIADILVRMALWLRRYADKEGIITLDFQAYAMDPATGGMKSTFSAGGDGVHPGIGGQRLLGGYVSDTLSPLLPSHALPLVASPLDVTNLTPNGRFVGTPTSGLAPSTFAFGAIPAGAAASVTTDAAVSGSMQRVTCTATTADTILAQRMTRGVPNKWNIGDVIAYCGLITTSGVSASVIIDYNAAPYGLTPIDFRADVTRGAWYVELAIPATITVDYIDFRIQVGSGTGYAEFGQITAYNLTKLGIA